MTTFFIVFTVCLIDPIRIFIALFLTLLSFTFLKRLKALNIYFIIILIFSYSTLITLVIQDRYQEAPFSAVESKHIDNNFNLRIWVEDTEFEDSLHLFLGVFNKVQFDKYASILKQQNKDCEVILRGFGIPIYTPAPKIFYEESPADKNPLKNRLFIDPSLADTRIKHEIVPFVDRRDMCARVTALPSVYSSVVHFIVFFMLMFWFHDRSQQANKE